MSGSHGSLLHAKDDSARVSIQRAECWGRSQRLSAPHRSAVFLLHWFTGDT